MRKLLVVLILGIVVGGVAFNARAQDAAARLLGLQSSHVCEETFYMSLSLTAHGRKTRPVKVEEFREVNANVLKPKGTCSV